MIESLDERNGNNKLNEIRMRNAENEKMKSFKKLYDFENFFIRFFLRIFHYFFKNFKILRK